MHAVTALAWIPCGVTPPTLGEAAATDDEINAYLDLIGGRPGRAARAPDPVSAEDAAVIARYHLENYDDDDAPPAGIIVDDPYRPAAAAAPDDDDDRVRATDLLLMVGKTGEQIPSLEVQLFDPHAEAFFVHHELMVPSFPLCVRWLDCAPATLGAGSFGAIATFERHIEIWDMNVAEPLRPAAVLQFHEDAVPALAWNVLQRGALLSASVDARAAVWALGPCRPAAVFDVGAPCRGAEWCPADAALFAVAAERGCALFDARQPHPLLAVPAAGGAEVIAWETAGERFAVGDVGGAVALFDRRAPAAPVLRAHAHQAAVTSLALCRAAPVLASTGEDGFCRIWRIEDAAIAPIAEEHMNDGRIYASAFSPDRQTLLAVGGDGEDAQLWDIANLLEGTGE